jgi:hypothetical protein
MKKYSEYLLDKEKEKLKANEVMQYTDNEEVNKLRQLVEDMSKWMSIGNNRAKVPKKTIAEFTDTMKRANHVKTQNMAFRLRKDGR